MLKIDNLSYSYGQDVKAVDSVTIEVPKEHIFAILGLSGSGKTTLLNCIAKFITPQSGTIVLHGTDIQQIENLEFREKIGVVFQHLNLFPHKTVLENLTLAPVVAKGLKQADVEKEAHSFLKKLGVGDLADSYPSEISGGEAQRVAIARGLMLKPEYMLLDEPTSALDSKTTDEFATWLKELRSDTSFIIVTHDIPFAQSCAEHGVFMDSGQVVKRGSITEITEG